jgi:hypothetical protein
LLALEEKKKSLENLKGRQQTVKKYFEKWAKTVEFKIDEKFLLWDSTHAERGRNYKFQKLWIVPFKIAYIIGTNSYLLKDMDERRFSYSTNGSHLKHYAEPAWSLTRYCVNMIVVHIFVFHLVCHFWFIGFWFLLFVFFMVIGSKVWINFSIVMSFMQVLLINKNKVIHSCYGILLSKHSWSRFFLSTLL